MTAPTTGPHQREAALARLLGARGARLLAVGADGTPVPLPGSVPSREARPGPGARRGLHLDTVLPQDRAVLIAAWESAHRCGVGTGRVRMARRAEVLWLLTVVDARPEHGVFLTTMVAVDPASGPAREPARAPVGGAVERRPRTGSVVKDVTANVVDVDDRFLLMLELTREAVLGRRSLDLLHPDDHELAVAAWVDLFDTPGSQRVRLRHRRGDGTWLWVDMESALRGAENLAESTVHCLLTDVSDEMAAHEALRRQERLLHRLTESLPLGIAQLTTDRSLVHATTRLADVLGVDAVTRVEDVLDRVAPEDRARLDAALDRVLAGGVDEELEVGLHGVDGEPIRRGAVTLVALGEAEGAPGALLCLGDVTSRAQVRDELVVRATHDALTGCHNRAAVCAALERALAREVQVAVSFLDVDDFKQVNDTHGHAAGDAVLVAVADRLQTVLRHGDVVGRFGGDEFLVISADVPSATEAHDLAQRLQEALAGPVALTSTVDLTLRVSIGVALSDPAEPGVPADTLILRADRAMYRAKRARRAGPVVWTPELG